MFKSSIKPDDTFTEFDNEKAADRGTERAIMWRNERNKRILDTKRNKNNKVLFYNYLSIAVAAELINDTDNAIDKYLKWVGNAH